MASRQSKDQQNTPSGHRIGIATMLLAAGLTSTAQAQSTVGPQQPADAGAPAEESTTAAAPSQHEPEWKLTPRVVAEINGTDNVRLTHDARAADLFTTVDPGVNLSAKTHKVTASLDADLRYNNYLNTSDLNGSSFRLSGNGKAELWEKALFFDLRSDISQQSLDRNGPSSNQLRTLPSNQAEVLNNTLSPYFKHDFGTFAGTELRYRLSTTNFINANTTSGSTTPAATSTSLPNDTVTNEFSVNLHSGPDFTALRWSLDADTNTAQHPGNRQVSQSSSTVDLEYLFMREFSLFTKFGTDSSKDSLLSHKDLYNGTWRIGTNLTPGPRTHLTFEAGERYGGPYWSTSLSYKLTSRLLLTVSRDITVTTQQQQYNNSLANASVNSFGQLIDPLTHLPVDPNQSLFSIANQTYTMKTNHLTLAGDRGRNNVSVSVVYTERTLGAQAQSKPGQQQSLASLSTTYTRHLTPDTDLSAEFDLSRAFDQVKSGNDTIGQLTLTYSYKLTNTVSTNVSYRHYDLRNQVQSGYQENEMIMSLRKTF